MNIYCIKNLAIAALAIDSNYKDMCHGKNGNSLSIFCDGCECFRRNEIGLEEAIIEHSIVNFTEEEVIAIKKHLNVIFNTTRTYTIHTEDIF